MTFIRLGTIQRDNRALTWIPWWDIRALIRGWKSYKVNTGMHLWSGRRYNGPKDQGGNQEDSP